MIYLDDTNAEYGVRRVVKDDTRNPGHFTALTYCAVTGRNLTGVENIDGVERAKEVSLEIARKSYT